MSARIVSNYIIPATPAPTLVSKEDVNDSKGTVYHYWSDGTCTAVRGTCTFKTGSYVVNPDGTFTTYMRM